MSLVASSPSTTFETESSALQNITEDLPNSSYNRSRPVRKQTKIGYVTNRDISSSSDEDDAVDPKSPLLSPPAKKTAIKKKASTLPRSPSRPPPAKKKAIKKIKKKVKTLPRNWKKKTNLKGNLDLLTEKLIPDNLKKEITTPYN